MAASHQWYKAVGSGYDVLLHVQAQPPMFEEHQFAAYVVGRCWKWLEVVGSNPGHASKIVLRQLGPSLPKDTKDY